MSDEGDGSPQPDPRVLKVYRDFGRAVQDSMTPSFIPSASASPAASATEGTPGRVAEARRLWEAKAGLHAAPEDGASSVASSDLSAATSEVTATSKQASPNSIWGRLKNAAVQNKYVTSAVSRLTEAAEAQRILACERADAAAAERDAALQQRDEVLCLLSAIQRERDDALQLAAVLRRGRDENRVIHVCAGGILLFVVASGSQENKHKAAAATAALVLLGRNAALSCLAAGISLALLNRVRGGGMMPRLAGWEWP